MCVRACVTLTISETSHLLQFSQIQCSENNNKISEWQICGYENLLLMKDYGKSNACYLNPCL